MLVVHAKRTAVYRLIRQYIINADGNGSSVSAVVHF